MANPQVLRSVGYCPACEQRQDTDQMDVLFDMKPSCSKCGSFLMEPFDLYISDGRVITGVTGHA